MTRSRRLRWAAGALAVGALAVSQAVAGTAATALGAAARPAVHGGSGMIPAIGTHPPRQKAGAVTPGVQPNYPLIFNCQKPTASVTCYGPDQIRTAYGFDTLINAGYTGKGRTIVIVDAFSDPALRRDLRIFDQVFDLPGANLTVVAPDGETPFDPTDANQVGWSGEIALDVEYAHAMAPGAKIVLVEAKTNTDSDIQSALQYVADNNLGDVVSQSFGEAENCLGVNADGTHQPGVTLAAAHRQYKQMTDEGMTVFASAGDEGSAQPTCDGSGFRCSRRRPRPATRSSPAWAARSCSPTRAAARTTTRSCGTRRGPSATPAVAGSAATSPSPASSTVSATSRAVAFRTSRTAARSTAASSSRGASRTRRARSTSSVGRAPVHRSGPLWPRSPTS